MKPTKYLIPVSYTHLWEATPPIDFPNYEAGTRGPAEADALIAKDGHTWML